MQIPAPLGAHGLLHGGQRPFRSLLRDHLGQHRTGNGRHCLGRRIPHRRRCIFPAGRLHPPVALPGGDRAVYESDGSPLHWYTMLSGREPGSGNCTELEAALAAVPLPEDKRRMLVKLLDHADGMSSCVAAAPQTPSVPTASSIGRLFDASAPSSRPGRSFHDGEGAALVEALSPEEASGPDGTFYEVHFYEQNDLRIFDTRPMIHNLLNDIRDGISPGLTAMRFMNTLIRMALDQCRALNPQGPSSRPVRRRLPESLPAARPHRRTGTARI